MRKRLLFQKQAHRCQIETQWQFKCSFTFYFILVVILDKKANCKTKDPPSNDLETYFKKQFVWIIVFYLKKKDLLCCLQFWRSIMPDQMSRPLIRERNNGGNFGLLETNLSDPCDPVIGILGTGDFSRSLARRLVASGYRVVVGSRTPKRSVGLFPEDAEVNHTHTRSKTHQFNWCFCFFSPGDNIFLWLFPPGIIAVLVILNTHLIGDLKYKNQLLCHEMLVLTGGENVFFFSTVDRNI